MSMEKFNQSSMTVQHWMECYNVTEEPDDNDLLDKNILESGGTRTMEGFGIFSDQILNPLKFKKVNIGSPENPKFANIKDY